MVSANIVKEVLPDFASLPTQATPARRMALPIWVLINGGQAEYLRVPYREFNCLALPPDAEEKQNDYVMLSDIFPTGYHATELAGMKPGESVVIYGAGPVGLMAAYSASLKGAGKIMVVYHFAQAAARERSGCLRTFRCTRRRVDQGVLKPAA